MRMQKHNDRRLRSSLLSVCFFLNYINKLYSHFNRIMGEVINLSNKLRKLKSRSKLK